MTPAPQVRPVDPLPVPRTFEERPPEAAAIDTFLAPATADPPPPSPETAQAVVDDLGTRDFDIPIPLNEKVLSFVELFSGRLKGYLEEGLGRGSRYLPMVRSIFEAEGLPLDLSYVPLIESAFKPSAVSRAKAAGDVAVHARHRARERARRTTGIWTSAPTLKRLRERRRST